MRRLAGDDAAMDAALAGKGRIFGRRLAAIRAEFLVAEDVFDRRFGCGTYDA
ncbi:hypothetical protein D3C78_1976550 [compost metagenome]